VFIKIAHYVYVAAGPMIKFISQTQQHFICELSQVDFQILSDPSKMIPV